MSQRRNRKPRRRAAEVITVAWMLATFSALIAQIGAVGTYLLGEFVGPSSQRYSPLTSVPGLLLFTALITSTVSLVLIPIVYKVRRTPAPQGITVFCMAVGAAPLLMVFGLLWMTRS